MSNLSVQDAANILGISIKTLHRWEKSGKLVPQRTEGGHRRYSKEQILDFKGQNSKVIRLAHSTSSGQASSEQKPNFKSPKEIPSSFGPLDNEYGDKKFDPINKASLNLIELSKQEPFSPADFGRTNDYLKKLGGSNRQLFGNILAMYKGLDTTRRKIITASIVLLFLAGSLVLLSRVNYIRLALNNIKSDTFQGNGNEARIGFRNTPDVTGIVTDQRSSGQQVLAAETARPNFIFGVNVPSFFREDAEFLKGLKVQGKVVLTEGQLETPDVIYSLTAGTGVSVAGGQTPTITNTGVTSFQSSTGAITLTAGTGITIDGTKITNSLPEAAQNTFKTIKLGSSTFDAGSSTDTLEFAAGTGASLSIDTTNKKLTIGATGTSGWTDGGTSVYLTTSTDSVGIGTSSPGSNLEVAGTAQLKGASGTTGLYVNSSGNVGIGTTSPSYALDVSGSANITGALTVSGNLITSGTSGTQGWMQRNAGTISPQNITDDLTLGATATSSALFRVSGTDGTTSIKGGTTIAPTANNTTALTLRASPSLTGSIMDVTSQDGATTYLSITSAGKLSGGAFQLTDINNTMISTAVEGGWTMNSNTFTYRRVITITNNTGVTLPKYYQLTLALSSGASSQVYTNTNTKTTPWYDFRTAWDNSGTITEIARNVSSFTSSDVTVSFQLSAAITNGSTDTYYLYYKNTSLASISSSYSSYTGDVTLNDAESASGWTSGDDGFPLSAETTIVYKGSGSLKSVGMVDKMGTLATTSQTQISGITPSAPTGLSEQTSVLDGTNLYIIGGTNGTTDQTAVYKATIDGSQNISAITSTSQNALSTGVQGASAVKVATLDGGTGTDGTLDLSLGSGAGGCNGTGLSWNAGSSTCTIATATKSTFNFTTINVSNGTTLTTSGTTFPTLKATGNVTVVGTIDLAGKGSSGGASGYQPGGQTGSGTGGGGGGGWYSYYAAGAGGGGYGGAGGKGGGTAGGSAGITYDTQSMGSGGGGGYSTSSTDGKGGAGGGGIRIQSLGNITVSGTINANGVDGSSPVESGNDYSGGGGGSGGRITLQGNALTVSGSITANGGNGGYGARFAYGGGGGGGGRLTINYASIDTTGSTITANKGTGIESGANGNDGVVTQAATPPNVYVVGGKNGSTAQSAIQKASITSENIDTFSSTTASLPSGRFGHTAYAKLTGSTNYVYITGGNDGTNDQATVWRSSVDTGGDITTAFATTGQGQLPAARSEHAQAAVTISGTTYLYVIGGKNASTAQSTIYYASIDGSGNIGDWSTASTALPLARYGLSAVPATVGSVNYIYIFGGHNGTAPQTTVYRAKLDGSGDVTEVTATAMSTLPVALSGQTTDVYTSDSTNYFYTIGGTNSDGNGVVTVYKSTLSSTSTNYTATKTITSADLSNKNVIDFWVRGDTTGTYSFKYTDDVGGEQSCNYTIDAANTWEEKTCDISAVADRAAVTQIKFNMSSANTTEYTTYFDSITASMSAALTAPTTSLASQILGSANLSLNAQGTGAVRINSDLAAGSAGTGGMEVYNGADGKVFFVNSTGDASASGALVMNGASASATLDILNGQNLNIQTSVGGDAGLTSRLTLLNSGLLGIGTQTPLSLLHVSGGTTGGRAAMILDQTGATTNDLFTASSSGTTKFTIANNGSVAIAALSTATSTGLSIGALSGATANTGVNIGNISGTGTAASLTTGAISATGATAYQLNLGAISGANATSHTAINAGNISGTTAAASGITLGTLTGGTSTNYQITTGTLTGIASATNAQLNLGATVGAASATTYGINVGAVSGAGTASYGINVGANSSTATTNYGLNIGAVSGAGTNNYGLYVGAVSGAGTGNYAAIFAGGNVGIGITSPLSLLHLSGGTTGGRAALIVDQLGAATNDIFTASASGVTKFTITNDGTASSAGDLIIGQGKQIKSQWDDLALAYKSGANAWTTGLTLQDVTGYVGIGTTTPGEELEVNGEIEIAGGQDADDRRMNFAASDGSNRFQIETDLDATVTNDLFGFRGVNTDNILVLRGDGDVGIGTAAPVGMLDIGSGNQISVQLAPSASEFYGIRFKNGTIDGFSLFHDDGDSTLNIGFNATATNDISTHAKLLTVTTGGDLGIGTVTPLLRLDVQDSQAATAAAQIFNTSTNADADGLIVKLANASTSVVATTNHFLSFETSGIGIVGSIQGNGATGIQLAQNGIADFAEYLKKDETVPIEGSTLVCLSENGKVYPCSNTDDTIAGVSSENPFLLGGENLGQGSVAVAMSGVVTLKVSTEKGEIKPGDLITSSSSLQSYGTGVKATSKGQVVGKALEGFNQDGVGKIRIIVDPSWYDPSVSEIQNTEYGRLNEDISSIQDQIASLSSLMALASQGNTLRGWEASSSAEFLGNLNGTTLNTESATLSGTLMVLGRTTLNDLGVTGDVTIGTISIRGLDNEISTLGGPLKLQTNTLEGIEMLGGKVTIDTKGNIETEGKVTAQTVEAEQFSVLGAKTMGSAIIPAGKTEIEVLSEVATGSSKIFLTPTTLTDKQLVLKFKGIGRFKVGIKNPETFPISLDWWIVGN